MWTTADGHTLRVSGARLDAIVQRFGRPGPRGLLRAPSGGDPRGDVMRAVGRLARNSYRSVTHRHPATGRSYAVFNSHAAGRAYKLFARPAGPGEFALLSVRPAYAEGEYSDGHGHQMAQSALVNGLLGAGLQLQQGNGVNNDPRVIRQNRQQLVPAQGGGVRSNRNQIPDVSYVAADGRRVNVEIDTDPNAQRRHMQSQVRADPNAYHVSVLVDPNTGQVLQRQVFDPNRDPAPPRGRGGRSSGLPGHQEPSNLQLTALPAPQTFPPATPPAAPQVGFAPPAAPAQQPPAGSRRTGGRQQQQQGARPASGGQARPASAPARGGRGGGGRRGRSGGSRESEWLMESYY